MGHGGEHFATGIIIRVLEVYNQVIILDIWRLFFVTKGMQAFRTYGHIGMSAPSLHSLLTL